MQTLIELLDARPLENVLGVEMFRPERVVYVCPSDFRDNKHIQDKLGTFFRHRGLAVETVFTRAHIYDSEKMRNELHEFVRKYPDCALDITGGTDAALFAAGFLCAETQIPVVTYSRRQNCFYNLRGASFAEKLPCTVSYSVEDCILMAGGFVREGRVDNAILVNYLDDIEPFFQLFLTHRRGWTSAVTYMQRVSPTREDGTYSLEVRGGYQVKGERSSRINAPEEVLRDLEKISFISDLEIITGESVSFRFRDGRIRAWLRDVGSVLELCVYKACLDSGLFQDVHTSVIVVWDGDDDTKPVSNELDVVCTRSVTPVFISCKTSDVKTEALNELSVLRDRFGGKMAKAAIVTATRGGTQMRNRASELGITVIDLNDLTNGTIGSRLKNLMKDVK